MEFLKRLIAGKFFSLWSWFFALFTVSSVIEAKNGELLRPGLQAVLGLIGLTMCVYIKGRFDEKSIDKRRKTTRRILFFGGEALCLGFLLTLWNVGIRDFRLFPWVVAIPGILFARIAMAKGGKRSQGLSEKHIELNNEQEMRLKQLDAMCSAGLLTKEEHEEKRREILREL